MSPVYVVVTYPDVEAADAARIAEVQVFTECSAPLDDPCMVVYRCEPNGAAVADPLDEGDFA